MSLDALRDRFGAKAIETGYTFRPEAAASRELSPEQSRKPEALERADSGKPRY